MSRTCCFLPCDYASKLDVYQKATIVLKKLGENTVKVHFDVFVEFVEKYLTPDTNKYANLSISLRIIHQYSPDNRRWIRFQFHRKVFGLICFAEYHSESDLNVILRSFAYQKDQYVGQGLLSILLLIDCCSAHERAAISKQHPHGFQGPSVISVSDLGNEVSLASLTAHPTLLSQLNARVQEMTAGIHTFLLQHRAFCSSRMDSLHTITANDIRNLLQGVETDSESWPDRLDPAGIFLTPSSCSEQEELRLEAWDKSRSMRRRFIGRLWKHLGDTNLLLGASEEAKMCLEKAQMHFKTASDPLWTVSASEAQCYLTYGELRHRTSAVSLHSSPARSVRRSSSTGELSQVDVSSLNFISSSSSASVDTGGDNNIDKSGEPSASTDSAIFPSLASTPSLEVDSGLAASRTVTAQLLLERLREVVAAYKKCNQLPLSLEAAVKAFHFALELNMRADALLLLQLDMLHNLPSVETDMISLHCSTAQWYTSLGHHRKACFSLWRATQAAQQWRNAQGQPRPRYHRMYLNLLLVARQLHMELPKLELRPLTTNNSGTQNETSLTLLILPPVEPIWPSLQIVVLRLLLFVLDRQLAMREPQLSMTTLGDRLLWEWTEVVVYHLHLLNNWSQHLRTEDIFASFERIRRGLQNLQDFFSSSPRQYQPHRAVLTSSWRNSLPYTLLQRACVVVRHLPTILEATPLPMKGYLKPTQRVSGGLFAFQPEAHKLKERKRVTEVVWVMREKANVLFVLRNPLTVELRMTDMTLIVATGTDAVNESLYPLGDCILPPNCARFQYRISIYPQVEGPSRIVGLTYHLADCDSSLWLRNHAPESPWSELRVLAPVALCHVTLNLDTTPQQRRNSDTRRHTMSNPPIRSAFRNLHQLGLQDMQDIIMEQYEWRLFPGEAVQDVQLQVTNASAAHQTASNFQVRISCVHAEPTQVDWPTGGGAVKAVRMLGEEDEMTPRTEQQGGGGTATGTGEEATTVVDLIQLRSRAADIITLSQDSHKLLPLNLSYGQQVELTLCVNHIIASQLQYALFEPCDLSLAYLVHIEYESMHENGTVYSRRHLLLLQVHLQLGLQCFYWQPLAVSSMTDMSHATALFHLSNLAVPHTHTHIHSEIEDENEMSHLLGAFSICGGMVGEISLAPHCSTSVKLPLIDLSHLTSSSMSHVRDVLCDWMNHNVILRWSLTPIHEQNQSKSTRRTLRQGRLVFVRNMLPDHVLHEILLATCLRVDLSLTSVDSDVCAPCDLIPFTFSLARHSTSDSLDLRSLPSDLLSSSYRVQVSVCGQDGTELQHGIVYLLVGQTEITQVSFSDLSGVGKKDSDESPEGTRRWFSIMFLRSGSYRISMEVECCDADPWANSNAGVTGTGRRRIFNHSTSIPIRVDNALNHNHSSRD